MEGNENIRVRRERNRGSCYPLRAPTGYVNFGKSSHIWAIMNFTHFLKALLFLHFYDKTMGVREDQPWTRYLKMSDLEGPGCPPSSVPHRSLAFQGGN